MGGLGFFGPTPGPTAGPGSQCGLRADVRLERGDSNLRSFAAVQGALVMHPIFAYGSSRSSWLPPGQGRGGGMLRSHSLISAAIRRHAHPGRAAGGRKWRLGTKMWITNGTVAVWWCGPDAGRHPGFLVEKGTPGFRAPEIRNKWSLRASVTSELVLEDVVVDKPPACCRRLGPQGGALLSRRPATHRLGVLSAADACYQCALDYRDTSVRQAHRRLPAPAGSSPGW